MCSGENLRKYNILLQTQLLNIENPHVIQNGFLNENTYCHSKQNKIHLPAQNSISAERHSLLQIMTNDPINLATPSSFFGEEQPQQNQSFSVLKFNKNPGQENKVPQSCNKIVEDFPFYGLEEEDVLSVPYTQQRKIQKQPFKVLDAPAL